MTAAKGKIEGNQGPWCTGGNSFRLDSSARLIFNATVTAREMCVLHLKDLLEFAVEGCDHRW